MKDQIIRLNKTKYLEELRKTNEAEDLTWGTAAYYLDKHTIKKEEPEMPELHPYQDKASLPEKLEWSTRYESVEEVLKEKLNQIIDYLKKKDKT